MHRQRRQQQQLIAAVVAVIAIAAAVVVIVLSGRDPGVQPQLASGCVIADVSASTVSAREEEKRREYARKFGAFAYEIGTRGSGRLCIVFTSGNPTGEGTPLIQSVAADDPGADDAAAQVVEKVKQAQTDFEGLLRDPPTRTEGSSLVEAAVVADEELNPGDRLLFLSDGRQNSAATGRLSIAPAVLDEAAIDAIVARLAKEDLVADLMGVQVEFPLWGYDPTGASGGDTARMVAIRAFWRRWARETNATLVE